MRQRRPSGRAKAKGNGIFAVMGISIIVLLAVVGVLAVSLIRRPVIMLSALPQKVEELNFILFRGEVLRVDHSVPLNKYDRASYAYNGERLQYDDGETRAIFGIDVSAYQKEIEWDKVKTDGVEFAILRVGLRGYTEGEIYEDSRFLDNVAGAAQNGIPVGIYFYSQAITPEEAVAEANWVLERIKNVDVQYPVMFDWEFTGDAIARTENMDGDLLTECATAFCNEVAAAGYTPMVYFNMSLGYLYYDLAELLEYDFWLAELDEPPVFHYNFQMLQYSHSGTVAGIEGAVDLNISYIDYTKS